MINKNLSNAIAGLLLLTMFLVMFFSVLDESAIMDELAHIPAGYSYLTQKDYRLNPEHPPLIKDISAIPLLFLNLNFPTDIKAWTQDINGQWTMGSVFLYESGNDADKIIFWSRLPIIFLAVLFGWLFFSWVRKLYGNNVALFALMLFTFSPTMIAHSRYVTTDLGAAFGFFIGISAFLNYLKAPSNKNLIIAGIALGVALLLKFSLVLLVPLYFAFAYLWVFVSNYENSKTLEGVYNKLKLFILGALKQTLNLALLGLISAALITLVYIFHVWNYPVDIQLRDTTQNLSSFGFKPAVDLTVWMSDKPVLRAFGQYLHGFLMVVQRAAGGNIAYFLDTVSSSGSWYYFPVAYLLKETVPSHIFTILAIVLAVGYLWKTHDKSFNTAIKWMHYNFALVASILFIGVYWWQSMSSSLNIGVRHVLPTFPFIYLLVSREVVKWTSSSSLTDPKTLRDFLELIYEKTIKAAPRYVFIILIFAWMILTIFSSFPHYLPYYNEFAGGTKNGYNYITDSNYDWGQDLKRLAVFVEKNNIDKIRLEYFGGGSPSYYLGNSFEPWWSSRGEPQEGWFAISATLRQGAFGRPINNFTQKPEDSYLWLKKYEPVARVGYSIFVYKF
ncbi:MAG: hypothetical protein COU46_01080 [Candidatus Niyogibacteria bacterium CG10_big_fil_rev_8_21_14_0_10_42_19]|uniref:Glycosyltransferase RgtA/B/C/D-like domain-containing protein n=1 Tax=Candidatus Niyogibacteria bacterium CG10_big_fil_rev_8_21_14_0_10_42_19 TaxID=1974725 RepID=A0A2H0THR2_9BACT|nr:MAG: hypothetical protein COU46_01080 [Candidatus Niyogibacteria bacterium CG10_big_fil_rev_8_21_14_0_10_42_19]